MLTEEERLRTLSRSSAQITFRDDSRLRLNANSQAVIRRMRTDPLSRTEEAKVSLVEGDFYALLAGKSDRKKFEVQVPEVTTDVESRNFWVRRDDSGSKFTNFDDGVLRVAANGSAVDLGRNEGTLVRNGRQPTEKVGILGAVELLAPGRRQPDLRRRGGPALGAGRGRRGLLARARPRPGLRADGDQPLGAQGHHASPPARSTIGSYYWRIAALDKFGLPGSARRGLAVPRPRRPDAAVPHHPAARGGRADPDRPDRDRGRDREGRPAAAGRRRPARSTGRAGSRRGRPDPGAVELVLEATDAAGNRTERRRSFQYVPDEQAALRFDEGIPRLAPRHFVTGRDVISLTGTTDPGAQLLLRRRRPAAARVDLRRRGRPVHAERAAARGRQRVRRRRGPALGLHQPRRLPRHRRTATRRRSGWTLPPPTATVGRVAGAARPGAGCRQPLGQRPAGAADRRRVRRDGHPGRRATTRSSWSRPTWSATPGSSGSRSHLDQTAPELVGFDVSPAQLRAGEPLEVEVEARDLSGLRKAAPFRVSVGGPGLRGLSRAQRQHGTYRKTMLLPPEAVGRVALRDVEIEDYAGNKARFAFDR